MPLWLLLFFGAAGAHAGTVNIAKNANVFGSFKNAKYAVDGALDNNYASAKFGQRRALNFYIEFKQPMLIDSADIIWTPPEPDTFIISVGKDIFSYGFTKVIKSSFKKFELHGIDYRGKYFKITIPFQKKGKEIKLSEAKVYSILNDAAIIINGVSASSVSDTEIEIKWRSNVPVTGQISYVLDERLAKKSFNVVQDNNFSKKHLVSISGLLPGRKYYYIVNAFDNSGHQSNAPLLSVKTAGVPYAYYKELSVNFGTDSIVLKVNTGAPADMRIEVREQKSEVRGQNNAELGMHSTEAILRRFSDKKSKRKIIISNLLHNSAYDITIENTGTRGEMIRKEFKIKTQPINLVLHKPVKGTFDAEIADKFVNKKLDFQSRLTDGSTNYFAGMAQSGSVKKGPQFAIIDLGAEYPIADVIVKWRKLAYSQNYLIQFSKDGKKYRYVASNINPDSIGVSGRSHDGSPMLSVTTNCNNEAGRFVKVYIPWMSKFYVKHDNWDFVQIFEIEVIKSNKFDDWSLDKVRFSEE